MFKTVFREIKSSLGRYLAILAIIALGTGFFAGLVVTTPAMIGTVDSYMANTAFYDWRLISSLGYTQKQVDAMKELDYVSTAEGSVQEDFLVLDAGGSCTVFRAHSITNETNRLEIQSGRMPEKANECIADWSYFSEEDIGSTIRLDESNSEDTMDNFVFDEYTIVGIATTPNYINFERGNSSLGNGSVSGYVYIPCEGFDVDYFTEVYITLVDGAKIYSDEYKQLTTVYEDSITAVAEENANIRYEDIVSEAEAELADGQREYDDGYTEYQNGLKEYEDEKAKAEQELSDAHADLVDAEKEIKDGWYEYYDGMNKLPEERANAEKELADALAELEDAEMEYADGLKKLQDGEKEYADGLQELQDGEKEYEDGLQELRDGEEEYEDGLIQYKEGLKEYYSGKTELDAGFEELEEAEAELKAGKAELDAGRAELDAAKAQLDSSQQELDSRLDMIADGINQMTGSSLAGSDVMAGLEAGDPIISAAVGSSAAELIGAQRQIDAGYEEYEAGLAEYETGLAEYEAGYAEYETGLQEALAGREELEAGWAELEDAREQLEEARDTLDEGWAEINDARDTLDEGWADIEDARKELDDGWAELLDGRKELDDGWIEYDDGKLEIEEEFSKAERELNDAYYDLKDAEQELTDGWVEYEDGRAEADREFADAWAELNDAKQELADAEQELLDARREIDDIEEPKVYVLGRDTNVGYVSFENDSQIVAGIATVFPVFFILVAALVCITTMTRMVDEQRTEIGTYKALGYSPAQIMGKYLLYSGSASVVGCVIGFLLGTWLFPKIIWEAYSMMYGVTELEYYFDLPMGILSTLAYLGVSTFATWYACHKELRDVPAELIRPKAPKTGKRILMERIPALWKHVSFLYKVSIRNVLRYKQRMFMMMVGIGGCTALLITGFGVKDSIKDIVSYQYDEISLYEYSVSFTEGQTDETIAQLLERCGESLKDFELVFESSMDMEHDGKVKSVYVTAPAEGELENVLYLHNDDGPVTYPKKGEAIICKNIARSFDIGAGDEITVHDSDMNSLTLTVSAVFDQYVYNYIYISADSFIDQWGYMPEMKTAYVNPAKGMDVHEVAALLLSQNGVGAVTITEDMEDRIGNMMSSLDYIVLLLIICSGALAFIVLYNLTNINITERIREIATIKVLGFYPQETAGYVFRENITLTVLGMIVGVPMGVALLNFAMDKIRVDVMYFEVRIESMSYVWSVVLTIIFACIVNIVMYFKLERINMTEALKSIE